MAANGTIGSATTTAAATTATSQEQQQQQQQENILIRESSVAALALLEDQRQELADLRRQVVYLQVFARSFPFYFSYSTALPIRARPLCSSMREREGESARAPRVIYSCNGSVSPLQGASGSSVCAAIGA